MQRAIAAAPHVRHDGGARGDDQRRLDLVIAGRSSFVSARAVARR